MAYFEQYGKVGMAVKLTALPAPTPSMNGMIADINGDIYGCDGTAWTRMFYGGSSGYVVAITGDYETRDQTSYCDYSLDNGLTWTEIPYIYSGTHRMFNGIIENVNTIKIRCGANEGFSIYDSINWGTNLTTSVVNGLALTENKMLYIIASNVD